MNTELETELVDAMLVQHCYVGRFWVERNIWEEARFLVMQLFCSIILRSQAAFALIQTPERGMLSMHCRWCINQLWTAAHL